MKPENHFDALPVKLVIYFVGVIGVLSLLIAAGLSWMGKSGDAVLSISNGCVMGLIGLLGRTSSSQRQTPEEPIEVKASEPLPVVTRDEEESGDGDETPPTPPNNPSEFAKAVRTN